MIKHETAYDKSDATGYEPEKRASLEAQIANLADEIAYNAHDLEDGLRADLFTPQDLYELVIWQELAEWAGWHPDKPLDQMTRREMVRELIGLSVTSVFEHTAVQLEKHQLNTPEKLQRHHENIVSYQAEFGEKIKALKKFLYERMYRHYRLVRMQTKAERFIREIFEAYMQEPAMLPAPTQARLKDTPLPRVITDYIAGMTDRYALDEWEKLFNPYRRV
jgi:dGTPase